MEFLTWDTLELHLAKRNPCLLPIGGTRNLRIVYVPDQETLALIVPLGAEVEIPPSLFAEIELALSYEDEHPVLEVSVSRRELFPAFHQLAVLIARKYENPQATAIGAFQEAIDSWQALMQKKPLLSEDQQLGLFGELAALEGFIQRDGPKALECWTAYAVDKSERHDFRIGTAEIEVKSTRSRKRLHVIHGLTQMAASPGRDLYVLSLKFEHGGNSGTSLFDRVKVVRRLLKDDARFTQSFEEKLLAANYRDSDSIYYSTKLITADHPRLIPVDDQFPRITASLLENGLSANVISRIGEVVYRVDLDGLGWGPSAPNYQAIFGELKIE
jgi:hypothetical protein